MATYDPVTIMYLAPLTLTVTSIVLLIWKPEFLSVKSTDSDGKTVLKFNYNLAMLVCIFLSFFVPFIAGLIFIK